MELRKNIQMKLTFCVFTLLLVLTFSGAVSAIAVIDEETTAPSVIETGEKFYGPTPIQTAIDDADTTNGHHVQIQPGIYLEQLTVTKDLTISGVDPDPQETVIAYDTENGVITISTGVSVVLENLRIITRDQGMNPINNNGQLTLVNCIVNGVYYANEVSGSVETMQTQTMETMASGSLETELIAGSSLVETSVTGTDNTGATGTTMGTTPIETTGTQTSTLTGSTGTEQDPGVPLASLASGMLMVMGGTVKSRKE